MQHALHVLHCAGTPAGKQQPSRSSSLGSGGDLSTARDFVEENKVAAVAAAARRPVKAEAKSSPGQYMQKADFGQVRATGWCYQLQHWYCAS